VGSAPWPPLQSPGDRDEPPPAALHARAHGRKAHGAGGAACARSALEQRAGSCFICRQHLGPLQRLARYNAEVGQPRYNVLE